MDSKPWYQRLWEDAMKLWTQAPDTEHFNTLSSKTEAAKACMEQEQWHTAEKLWEEAIEESTSELGVNHPVMLE